MVRALTKSLETPIEYLKGVGPQRAEILKKELGIYTFENLLLHFPFRYVDKTRVYRINEITPETQFIQLKGIIGNFRTAGNRRNKWLKAKFTDETGSIELVWFRGVSWISKYLRPNAQYIVFGKPGYYKNKVNIAHPELSLVSEESNGDGKGMEPVYGTSEKLKAKGIDSKRLLGMVRAVFKEIPPSDLAEILPSGIVQKNKLIDRYDAFRNIHFPSDDKVLSDARKRLKYEELFLVQMKILKLKVKRETNINGFVFGEIGEHFNRYYKERLSFELTKAQKRVIKEIRQDLGSGKQMNRLLQGDVGSGKTVVALMTMLIAVDNGYQSCIMVPTEILANQHFSTISRMVEGLGVRTALLTGSVKGKERKLILEALDRGEIHFLIGTHALIEDDVMFRNLGMVIIDEQHRFGVAQRAKLWLKSKQPPHVLVMTATPIPRTLAMTLYGDLDVSVIDEMPPGRKPIKTVHRTDANRLRVFGFMKEEIAKGHQVYVVYPLIEESESMDYKDLMDGYNSITREFQPPDYQVGIMHGRMRSEDKDFEMQRFLERQTHIMVATSVIEVGVDVPGVTVMVIESAERFGLSQLHQLRGRVGRGFDQSYCILMSGYKLTSDARKRLQTMTETNNGFEIADVDLRLRGPGELEGTQQSGILNLKIADLANDAGILQDARRDAQEILTTDPELTTPGNTTLKQFLTRKGKGRQNWGRIS